MKVAIVHDYLREFGGAERVVEVLHEIFPDAPIYTAYYNPKGLGLHADRIRKWDIRTSWLQKVPFANSFISPLRIIAPIVFESFDFKEYDVVISSCAIYFSKAVITGPKTIHISYIHTPPRYLYGYTTSFNYKKNILTRIFGEIANHFLRIYDFETSQRPDILVANSKNVAARILKFYRREAQVIYPPVETQQFTDQKKIVGDYFLVLNRLVRGMGTDLIVEAATKLNIPLKVAGTGPELERLKKMAGKNVEFLGQVTDDERVKLYCGAKVFVTASEQVDFGITVVEAQAAGTPVIAPKSGGYLENIVEGKTGSYYEPGSVESLMEVMGSFDPKEFKERDCKENARRFSKLEFKEKLQKLIQNNLKT